MPVRPHKRDSQEGIAILTSILTVGLVACPVAGD
jgi:hypothetical protein